MLKGLYQLRLCSRKWLITTRSAKVVVEYAWLVGILHSWTKVLVDKGSCVNGCNSYLPDKHKLKFSNFKSVPVFSTVLTCFLFLCSNWPEISGVKVKKFVQSLLESLKHLLEFLKVCIIVSSCVQEFLKIL